MVKKKLKTEKIKYHSIFDYFKNKSQTINQSNSIINNINKIPKKNEIDNNNLNLKKERKIRLFKRIKKIMQKKKIKNKNIKLLTKKRLLNNSESESDSYNNSSKFSFKYNDSDKSSSSNKYNFNNNLLSHNKYKYNNNSDSNSSSIHLDYSYHKPITKKSYNNDSIFNYNYSLDEDIMIITI